MNSLPIEVMELIISKMVFQDVLTYPNIESINHVILLCPQEWHNRLFEYVKYVRDISKVKINTNQADYYLTIEDEDVRNNARLTTHLFSLQKICDGLLAKYETTYNWRVKQFHFLLNDDVNWNTDNIKVILHEVLLYYCNRIGFNRKSIVQKINLLKPYIPEFICLTSKNNMQKAVFQYLLCDLYKGDAKLLYIFITEGKSKVKENIWNDYCEKILEHVEHKEELKDILIKTGTSVNWNAYNIKNIVNICIENNLMITLNCHDSIIKHIVGDISYEQVEEILLEDKQERYERICIERLLSSGVSTEHFEDLFAWDCFEKFYQDNAIDKFVNTVKDIYKVQNIILQNGITMEDGLLYKNDICIDDYVEFDVWRKCIEDCISIYNDSNANINADKIIAFIVGLFEKLTD